MRLQANTAWAFATLEHSPGGALLEAIAVDAARKLPEFTAQNISNLLYALAKLEYKPESFLAAASAAARPILSTFTPQVALLAAVVCARTHCS